MVEKLGIRFQFQKQQALKRAVFYATADVSSYEEGLVEIDVRAFDTASNVSYQHISVQKDVTPPSGGSDNAN